MPAKDRNQQYVRHSVLCPYYKTSEPRSIRCEGIGGTTVRITFENGQQRKEHENTYCCKRYGICPYYLAHK